MCKFIFTVTALLSFVAAFSQQDSILFAGERHFKNVIQLTNGETMQKLIGAMIASELLFRDPIPKRV